MIIYTPESLTSLFVDANIGRGLAARIGVLFEASPCPPPSGRPGSPARPDGPCLLWLGRIHPKGYGAFGKDLVHRLSFTLHHGRAPRDDLGHRCEARLCGQPGHVREVTCRENAREGRNRRWPEEILTKAPAVPCAACAGPTGPSVQKVWVPGVGTKHRWSHTCAPCYAAYQRARRAGSLPRPPTGCQVGAWIPTYLTDSYANWLIQRPELAREPAPRTGSRRSTSQFGAL